MVLIRGFLLCTGSDRDKSVLIRASMFGTDTYVLQINEKVSKYMNAFTEKFCCRF